MAKRFTDSTKWARQNFRELSPKMKLAWLYILDSCDKCGLWHEDYDLLSFQTGVKVTRREVAESFGEKLIPIKGDKLFVPTFIEFQYGKLNPDSNPHKSVITILTNLGLMGDLGTLPEGYVKKKLEYLGTLEDKEEEEEEYKYKEQVKEKEELEDQAKEEGGVGGDSPPRPKKKDYEALYAVYPRKDGKTKGLEKCAKELKTHEAIAEASFAINRFAAHCRAHNIETQFIPYFSTFMGRWRDWLDPDAGSSDLEFKGMSEETHRALWAVD